MDNEFRLDLSEVIRSLQKAEVISIYFSLMRKTLLIDTRCNDLDGPMVRIVPMADTVEERIASLQRLRPRFPRPDSITILPWPKYVASLRRLGIWDGLTRRFLEAGRPETVRQLESLFQDLEALEVQEVRRAITGERYETLWEEGESDDRRLH